MELTLVGASLFSNILRLLVRFSLVYILFLFLVLRMRSGLRLRPAQGTLFSPTCVSPTLHTHIYVHLLLWYNNYSNVFPLCPTTSELPRRLPTISVDFRLPNFSDDFRPFPMTSDFRTIVPQRNQSEGSQTIHLICMTVGTKLTPNAAHVWIVCTTVRFYTLVKFLLRGTQPRTSED